MTQAARYCDARQPPAVATLPFATKGWFSTATPAASTHGLVVRSVHAGTPSSSPSLASTSAPEHCAPSSCRDGSSCSCAIKAASATTSRVCMPLPTITASASLASRRDACASSTTPFIDRTRAEGLAIDTRQPGVLMRLRMPSAMSESSSLKPSKVRMAMCMGRIVDTAINTIKKLSWIHCRMPQARYKQLVDAFAAQIREGSLPPGTRLPTVRKLAAQKGLALVTAGRVYAELQAMGLVSGETGRGTFVRESLLPRVWASTSTPRPRAWWT
jgi:hypothetical protein